MLVESPPVNRNLDYMSPDRDNNTSSSPYNDNMSERYFKVVTKSQELNKQIHELKLQLIQKDDEIFNLKRQLTSKQNEINSPNRSFNSNSQYQSDLINLVAQTEKKYEEQRKRNVEMNNQLINYAQDNQKYQQTINSLQNRCDELSQNEDIYKNKIQLIEMEYKQKLVNSESDNKNYKKLVIGYNDSISKYEEQILKLRHELESVTMEKNHLEIVAEEKKTIYDNHSSELQDITRQLNDVNIKLINTEKERDDYKLKIHQYSLDNIDKDTEINNLKERINHMNKTNKQEEQIIGYKPGKSPEKTSRKVEYYRNKITELYRDNVELKFKIDQLKNGYNTESGSEFTTPRQSIVFDDKDDIIKKLQNKLQESESIIKQLKKKKLSIDSEMANTVKTEISTQTPKIPETHIETQTNDEFVEDVEEISKLQDEVDEKGFTIEDLNIQIDDLKAKEEEYLQKIEDYENKINELNEVINDYDEELKTSNDYVEKYKRECEELQNQLDDLPQNENEIFELQSQIEELKQQLNNNNTQNSSDDFEEKENKYVDEINRLKKENEIMNQQLIDYEDKNQYNVVDEVEKYKVSIHEKDEIIKELQDKLENSNDEENNESVDNSELIKEIERMKGDLDKKDYSIQDLNNQLKELKERNSSLEERLKEKYELSPNENLEEIIKDKDEKIAELEEEIKSSNIQYYIEENKKLDQKIVELTIALSSLQGSQISNVLIDDDVNNYTWDNNNNVNDENAEDVEDAENLENDVNVESEIPDDDELIQENEEEQEMMKNDVNMDEYEEGENDEMMKNDINMDEYQDEEEQEMIRNDVNMDDYQDDENDEMIRNDINMDEYEEGEEEEYYSDDNYGDNIIDDSGVSENDNI